MPHIKVISSVILVLSVCLVNSTDPDPGSGNICFECTVDDENCTTMLNLSSIKNCTTDGKNLCFYKKVKDEKNEGIARGCTKSPDECANDKDNCKVCGGTATKCNFGTLPENRKQCYQCEGFDCADPKESDIGYCLKSDDDCFTYQSENTVIRNCKAKMDPSHTEKSLICENPKCNNKAVSLKWKCFRCRSDDPYERKCENEGINAASCNTIAIGDQKNECYTERLNGAIYRGCVLDMTAEDKERCQHESLKDCFVCHEPNCNFEKMPNSAHTISLSIVAGVISFALYFNYILL